MNFDSFDENLRGAINCVTSNVPIEVLEGLRVLHTASLDHNCRPIVRMHGGVEAVLQCLLPTSTLAPGAAWLHFEVLETAATTLLLLMCRGRGNTSDCRTRAYSSWKDSQVPASVTSSSNSTTSSTSSSTSSTSSSTSSSSSSTNTNWHDPNTAHVVHRLCSPRTLLSLLKSYAQREVMVNSLSWLLLATCGVDGKTGLLARNDGGIHFLLDLLRTPLELEGGEQSSRSPGSLVAPLLLLCLFTKSSDTNVATISKFSGFQLLCKIADNYRREPRMSEIALEVLSNCCRLDKFATICGRMSPSVTVSTSVISWFARSWTDRGGGRGGDLGGPSSLSSSSSSSSTMRREEVELIESALRLLFRLASSSSNVSSVVCSGCLEHVHFLLNADTTSISSRALCCKVCWKLLSIVRGRGTETRIDFDRLRLWRQQQQGVGGGRGKRRQGRRRKEEEEEESGGGGGGGGEDRNQSAAASILSVGSEGLIEAKEEVEGVVVVSDEDEEMLRQQGCVSPAAKECHLTEMEMDFYRKFPERIDLPSANGADDEDDSDLHGWRTGRQQDDDDDDSSGGVPSLNPRRANIVRRALCDEIERALVEVVDGGRLGAPTFVVHHALLPTTSSPLCRSSLSATEVGRPLRLHSNATRDWISVQRQCINRMMSTRSGKRSGSSSSSSSRDDDDEEVLVYDRDTKVLEGGRLGDQRVTREDLAEKEEEKVKEEEEEEKLRSRIVETRREARRSEEAKRSREVAGAPPSSYGFKCSEEEDLRANSKVEEEVGGRGVPASAMAASGVPESGVQDGSSPSSTWSSRPLVFESRFESGNLDRAFRTGEFEYNLIVTNDTSNRNSTQWYFFSVFGMKRGIRYCFNVINLDKTTSQYNAGMLPCVYSEIKAEEKGEGWFRRGDSVCYYQNLYTKTKGAGPASSSSSSSRDKKTSACFTLSWSDVHDYDGDRVYYSYCLPYTTTDMLAKVRGLDIHEENGGGLRGRGRGGDGGGSGDGDGSGSGEGGDDGGGTKTGGERRSNACGERNILRRTLLCRSLSGLPVPLLTITDFQSTADEIKKRRYVVLSARVHPGESPASFMIDGVIDLLLGDTSLARALRHLAVFKIIPMLNPDGVATGNHRCNLVGHDLNRQWTAPTREESPTIYHLKELLKWQSLSSIDDMSRTRFLSHGVPSDRGVAMFCDFHAHSRSFNIFIYGCESANHVDEKIFPYLLSAANTNFSYKDCNFKIQGPKSKKANCGRIVARKHCGVLNTYTIETSFAGVDIGLQAGLHFVANDWTKLGHDFGATMYDLLNEGGMVYSQAHAAVTHMLPPKIEESASSSSSSTTTSSSSSDRKLKTSGGKRLKKKKKKSTGRAKTAEAGMRRKR